MNNLTVIGILIIVMWLLAIAYYFYVSRKQSELSNDIQELRDTLDKAEEDSS